MHKRESEDLDPYEEGFNSSDSATNPYRAESEFSALWRLGRRDAGKCVLGLASLFAVAFAGSARADIVQLDFQTHVVSVATSADLPPQFAYAATGGLVQHADAASVVGGAYFPDGSDHGWTVLPAIPAANIAPAPWSFELLAANPAEWQVDIAGSADPSLWNVVGSVTDGFAFLQELGSGPSGNAYGLQDVPLDAAGSAYVLTDVQQAPLGFPIFVPEPASLLLLAAGTGLLLLQRRRALTA